MTEYKPTRGDKKKFLRDLQPGKTYYSIEEADTPLRGMQYVRPWVFKKSRLWVGVCGPHSAEYVLANYGPLYDKRPAGIPDLFDDSDPAFEPDLEGPEYQAYQRALRDLRRTAQRMVSAR